MNKSYRVIWSKVRGCFVVADENAKTKGKPSSTRKAIAAAIAAMSVSQGALALPPVGGSGCDPNYTGSVPGAQLVNQDCDVTVNSDAVMTHNGTVITVNDGNEFDEHFLIEAGATVSGSAINEYGGFGDSVIEILGGVDDYDSVENNGIVENYGTVNGEGNDVTGIFLDQDMNGYLNNGDDGLINIYGEDTSDPATARAYGIVLGDRLAGTGVLENSGTINVEANAENLTSSYHMLAIADAYGIYLADKVEADAMLLNSGNITVEAYATSYDSYGSIFAADDDVYADALAVGIAVGELDGGDLAGFLANDGGTITVSAVADATLAYGSASGYAEAYGISVDGSILNGAALTNSGSISVNADAHGGSADYNVDMTAYAYGIYVDGNLATGGLLDNSGTITVSASAAASYGDDISATAYAYGVWVGGTLGGTITNSGYISVTANATAEFGTDSVEAVAYAYGIYVGEDIVNGGLLSNSGTISASSTATASHGDETTSATAYAYGIYVGGDIAYGGSLVNSGVITAGADAVVSYGDSSSTTALASAYGVYVDGEVAYGGSLINSGMISVVADANGSYSYGDEESIEVTAYAYGVYVGDSLDGLIVNSGTITATASATGHHVYESELYVSAYAYGIYVGSDITDTGVLTNSGVISASATATAHDVFNTSGTAAAEANGVFVSGDIEGVLANSGTISAIASAEAYDYTNTEASATATAYGVLVDDNIAYGGTLANSGIITASAYANAHDVSGDTVESDADSSGIEVNGYVYGDISNATGGEISGYSTATGYNGEDGVNVTSWANGIDIDDGIGEDARIINQYGALMLGNASATGGLSEYGGVEVTALGRGFYAELNMEGVLSNGGTISGVADASAYDAYGGAEVSAYAYGVRIGGDSRLGDDDVGGNLAFSASITNSGSILANASATANTDAYDFNANSDAYAEAGALSLGEDLSGSIYNYGGIIGFAEAESRDAVTLSGADAYATGLEIENNVFEDGLIVNGSDFPGVYNPFTQISGATISGTAESIAYYAADAESYASAAGIEVGLEFMGTLSNGQDGLIEGVATATSHDGDTSTAMSNAWGFITGEDLSGDILNLGTMSATATAQAFYAAEDAYAASLARGIQIGADMQDSSYYGSITDNGSLTNNGLIYASSSAVARDAVDSESLAEADGVWVFENMDGTITNTALIQADAFADSHDSVDSSQAGAEASGISIGFGEYGNPHPTISGVMGDLNGMIQNSGIILGNAVADASIGIDGYVDHVDGEDSAHAGAYAYGVNIAGSIGEDGEIFNYISTTSGTIGGTATVSADKAYGGHLMVALGSGIAVGDNMDGLIDNTGLIYGHADAVAWHYGGGAENAYGAGVGVAFADGILIGDSLTGVITNSGTIEASSNYTLNVNVGEDSQAQNFFDLGEDYASGVYIGEDIEGGLLTNSGSIIATSDTDINIYNTFVGGDGTITGQFDDDMGEDWTYNAAVGVHVGGSIGDYYGGALDNSGTITATATTNFDNLNILEEGDFGEDWVQTEANGVYVQNSIGSFYGDAYINNSGTISGQANLNFALTGDSDVGEDNVGEDWWNVGIANVEASGIELGEDLLSTGEITNSGLISGKAIGLVTANQSESSAYGAAIAWLNVSSYGVNIGDDSGEDFGEDSGSGDLDGSLVNLVNGQITAYAEAKGEGAGVSAYGGGLTFVGANAYGVNVGEDLTGQVDNFGTITATAYAYAYYGNASANAIGIAVGEDLSGNIWNEGLIRAEATGGTLSGNLWVNTSSTAYGIDVQGDVMYGGGIYNMESEDGSVSGRILAYASGEDSGVVPFSYSGPVNPADPAVAGILVRGALNGEIVNQGTIGGYGQELDLTVPAKTVLIDDHVYLYGMENSTAANSIDDANVYSVYVESGAYGEVVNAGILDGQVYLGGTVDLDNNGLLDTRRNTSWVGGNYTQGADGTFVTELLNVGEDGNNNGLDEGVTADGDYGRLMAGGNVNVTSGSNIYVRMVDGWETEDEAVRLVSGSVVHNVIEAYGGILTYTEGSVDVTDNVLGLQFEDILDEDGNAIDLAVRETNMSSMGGAVRDELDVAEGLAEQLDEWLTEEGLPDFENIPGGPDGTLATLIKELLQANNKKELSQTLASLLPMMGGQNNKMVQSDMRMLNRIIQARQDGQIGRSTGDGATADSRFWLKPFGSWGNQDEDFGYDSRTYGVVAGIDTEVGDSSRVGGAFGYAKSDVESDYGNVNQNVDVNTYWGSLYGSYSLSEATEVNFQVDLGWHDTDGRRTDFTGSAHSQFDSWSTHVGVGIGHTLELGEATTLTPSIRADYTYSDSDGYRERGSSLFLQDVEDSSMDELILSVDGKLVHAFTDSTKFSVNLGAGYDVIGDRSSVGTSFVDPLSPLTFDMDENDRSEWLVRGGLGLTVNATESIELNAKYDFELREETDNQSASVKLRWMF